MATYSISLDDVELALLPPCTNRYNDFLKKDHFEFQVVKKEFEDSPTIFYTCHLCAIEVPAAFASEHAASVKHRANARIVSISAQRVRALITALPPPFAEPPNARFCANCTTIAGKNHELTKEHSMAVMHDKLLWDLMKAYVNGKDKSNDDENKDENTKMEMHNSDQGFENGDVSENGNLEMDKNNGENTEATYLFIETTSSQYVGAYNINKNERNMENQKTDKFNNGIINNHNLDAKYEHEVEKTSKFEVLKSKKQVNTSSNSSAQNVYDATCLVESKSLGTTENVEKNIKERSEENKTDINYIVDDEVVKNDTDKPDNCNSFRTKKINDFITRIKATLPVTTRWHKMETKAKELLNEEVNKQVKTVTEVKKNIALQLLDKYATEPYLELLHKVIDTNNSYVELKELDGAIQIVRKKQIVQVPLDHFHGYIYHENGIIECIVCKTKFPSEDEETHKYELDHMNKVAKVGDNSHCIRKVTSKYSQCIICNIQVRNKNAIAHILSLDHAQNKNTVTIVNMDRVKKTIQFADDNEYGNKDINDEIKVHEGIVKNLEDNICVSEIKYPYEEASVGRVRCVICDSVMLSCNMKIHLQGLRHLNNVRQLTATNTATADEKKTNTIDGCKGENSVKVINNDQSNKTIKKYSDIGSEVTYEEMLNNLSDMKQHKNALRDFIRQHGIENATTETEKENDRIDGSMEENGVNDIDADETRENNKKDVNISDVTYPYVLISPGVVHCIVCDKVILNSVFIMEQHKNTLGHLKLIKGDTTKTATENKNVRIDCTKEENDGKDINEDNENETIKKHSGSGSEVTYPFDLLSPWEVRCMICDRNMLNNLNTMKGHKTGLSHLKKVRRMRTIADNAGSDKTGRIDGSKENNANVDIKGSNGESETEYPFQLVAGGKLRCVICDINLLNINVISHLNGARHKKNIKTQRRTQKTAQKVNGDIVINENAAIGNIKNDGSEVSYPFEKASLEHVHCTICDSFVPYCLNNMEEHKKGSRHMKNEFKIEKELVKRWVADAKKESGNEELVSQ